jgi:hypothetical protein
MDQQFDGKLSFEAISLEANLGTPEAIPLFLRQLKPETIRDVLLGRLMGSAFLFLDWKELTMIVKAQGAELEWSSFKEGRRQQAKPFAQRLLTIGGRVPRIRLEKEKLRRRVFEALPYLLRRHFSQLDRCSIHRGVARSRHIFAREGIGQREPQPQ